ncbi:hypothetical protein SAMN04489757_17110 [Anaerocolumna aminovalerica]|uniref:Uncharacterized protein n=2 Tax=Anaerocolumna aminovalerica TaxID=1527 RepID=A0A1I5J7I6_9FIRM|nr:hypothetical protein SAMN04489757_17110 [Anaerocolumna aminovalerica]
MSLLVRYVNHTGEREYLFYNKKNSVLRVRSLETLLKNALLKAEIDKPYTLQDIRNASIAYMIHSCAKSNEIADYAGVSDRWIYRYDKIIDELNYAPCDYVHFRMI